MKEELVLRLLSKVMQWDDDRARGEFEWLRIMSRYKYDNYRGYLAGARFTENLLSWLQQFDEKDRETAYGFVRKQLVYVSAEEFQHLVELTYPETIRRNLIDTVAKSLKIWPYQVWAHKDGQKAFKECRRRTLVLGLSDGARLDSFRRVNSGIIGNEQIAVSLQLPDEKWDSLLESLREDLGDGKATFDAVYLIDDFLGSGKTLIRQESQCGGEPVWVGKLEKFRNDVVRKEGTHLSPDWTLHVHHYLATPCAKEWVETCEASARQDLGDGWFSKVVFSFGMVFPDGIQIVDTDHPKFFDLIDKYYDSSVESRHSDVGGEGFRRGFAGCALPMILEHNTPNNSFALLWAETSGENGRHAMRPLFKRQQRHV